MGYLNKCLQSVMGKDKESVCLTASMRPTSIMSPGNHLCTPHIYSGRFILIRRRLYWVI